LEYTHDKVSFVWLSIGAGELEEQSKDKMDSILPDRNSKTLGDALQAGFEEGDVTFINWEAVNRVGNKAIRIGEMKNIIDRIAEAHKKGISFILIVDEEHRSNTGNSAEFMMHFSASNVIRVSATPIQNDFALKYEIPEFEVIASGLITSAMYVNDGVSDDAETDMSTEYLYLLDLAIKKRYEIQAEYEKINRKIRPLVIIQFPDSSNRYIEEVEAYLKDRGYSYENGFAAKWLSEEKINIEKIEAPNATPVFLLWKQALSTGWDCPRAKILVKLRDNMSDSFEIQTIGRIRRMPEARHYENELLDNCYMYTFDEEWKEKALEDPSAFETRRVMIKEEGRELILTREVRDSSLSNFGEREVREILSKYFVDKYKLKVGTRLSLEDKEENKKKMEADSWVFGTAISRIYLRGKFVKVSDILSADETKKGITTREVSTHDNGRDLMHIINELHGIIFIRDSVIRSIVKTLFHRQQYRRGDNVLALDNREWYAFVINNRDRLKEVFREIKARNLEENLRNKQLLLDLGGMEIFYKEREFRIPLSEVYRVDSLRSDLKGKYLSKNVYDKYEETMITDKTRSKIEQKFEYYCDKCDDIQWFYKNGDKGDKYFSIAYRTGFGQVSLFYPDYIIQMKNGDIWIIETKGGERSGNTDNIDKMAPVKFDAFRKYVTKRHPEIKWGFVRNIGETLFFNNTEWTEAISGSDKWSSLSEVF
jgi:type III restriction enzyme